MSYTHVTAMLNEAVHYLNCHPGRIYVDCTLGGGGHARAILERILPKGHLIAMDQDADAIAHARQVLEQYQPNVRLIHDNFVNLPSILSQLNITAVDGILLDLGMSLHHVEASRRGFSFRKDEPLDMRMDIRTPTTAADIVNNSSEKELARLFRELGEERWAKPIAKQIVRDRRKTPINTSSELAGIVTRSVPRRKSRRPSHDIHPATRVFMALRIAVNAELEKLEQFLANVADLLHPGGRLCVLSFHSLEDRIVKQHFKALAKGCTCPPDLPQCVCGGQPRVRILTKRPLVPTDVEVARNPMARSTKLRAVEKL